MRDVKKEVKEAIEKIAGKKILRWWIVYDGSEYIDETGKLSYLRDWESIEEIGYDTIDGETKAVNKGLLEGFRDSIENCLK